MIERACTQGAALFDFGIGDQAYKRSWCDVETVQHDILLSLNLRGRLMAAGITSAVAAKRLLKQNPRAYRIAQKLRFLKARLVSRKAS
jgi:CelD/BcsL family acetyltransferase involved in cellulose biosynthesis